METLVDFFTLRPVFTFAALRVVWYVYLTHTIIQLYISFSEVGLLLAQRHISWANWSPNAIPLLLGVIAQVLLVRVLLEVAGTILLAPRGNPA
jgi:hypothetical protein